MYLPGECYNQTFRTVDLIAFYSDVAFGIYKYASTNQDVRRSVSKTTSHSPADNFCPPKRKQIRNDPDSQRYSPPEYILLSRIKNRQAEVAVIHLPSKSICCGVTVFS